MQKYQKRIKSKIGPLFIVVSDKGLNGIFWDEQDVPNIQKNNITAVEILSKVETQLSEYFEGKRKEFDLALDAEGTDFQKRVWARLQKIPYGQTKSYKDIAAELKKPNACRAVGNANGKNPISLIVPCHRVIAADGSIGGYAGGLHIKKFLLDLEKKNS